MKKKRLMKKTLVCAIIVLLIGAGFTSSGSSNINTHISDENKINISSTDSSQITGSLSFQTYEKTIEENQS